MIYHITARSDWEKAKAKGSYIAPSLETEGFIHNSSREQILNVANSFYRGEDDLVILCIDESELASTVVWEAPAHPDPDRAPREMDSELFAHVYGAISANAVVQVVDFPEGDDGFSLPADLP